MNQLLANILTNLPENFWLMAFCIVVIAFAITFLAVLWLGRLVWRLRRECENLTTIVNGNKNDVYGLCSAALSVNENTAKTHEQLHDLKQQLASVVEKMNGLQHGNLANNPYNVDIRKIREGAGVEDLMRQSDLSYDEAALLMRLHGGKA